MLRKFAICSIFFFLCLLMGSPAMAGEAYTNLVECLDGCESYDTQCSQCCRETFAEMLASKCGTYADCALCTPVLVRGDCVEHCRRQVMFCASMTRVSHTCWQ